MANVVAFPKLWYSIDMQGVTTALVLFIFFCVVFPKAVKTKAQFYAAFWLVCGIILLDAVGMAIGSSDAPKFRVFAYFFIALMQIGAMLLLFVGTGGIGWADLAEDMKGAFEVIRRGGEEKEIIIPLTGQMPKPRATSEAPPERIVINTPPAPQPPPGAAGRSPDEGRIPLD